MKTIEKRAGLMEVILNAGVMIAIVSAFIIP